MAHKEQIFGRDVIEGSPRGERENEASDQAVFLMTMAEALSTYGSPAHRVERAMEYCARNMGIAAQFFSLPTAVYATLGEGWDARTYLRRVPVVSVNLERLVELDRVLQQVASRMLGVREATAALHDLDRVPLRYGRRWTTVMLAVTSAAVAPLFGGGWRDVVGAAVIGILISILEIFGVWRPEARRVLDFSAGILAAMTAAAAAWLLGPVSEEAVIISGLIVLMPGLTVTMAIKELSTVNLVAGTARLMGALMILISIAFGVAIGQQIGNTFPPPTGELPPALPVWVEQVALFVTAAALPVLFQARPRDIPSMICVGITGYYGAVLGGRLAGEEIGALLGASVVGLASNTLARIVNRPSAVTMVPGIILLVPGSVGFRSVEFFLSDDVTSGVATAFRMLLIAAALATGLLLANVAVPARREL